MSSFGFDGRRDSSILFDHSHGASSDGGDSDRAGKVDIIPGATQCYSLPGGGTLPHFFQLQESEVQREINLFNKNKAIKVAVKALRGAPEPPIFFCVKWESFIAFSKVAEPHLKQFLCIKCRKSLQALQEAADSVRSLQGDVTGSPQMMEDEYKFIMDFRKMLDAETRKLEEEDSKMLSYTDW